jgi:hypothetical protein
MSDFEQKIEQLFTALQQLYTLAQTTDKAIEETLEKKRLALPEELERAAAALDTYHRVLSRFSSSSKRYGFDRLMQGLENIKTTLNNLDVSNLEKIAQAMDAVRVVMDRINELQRGHLTLIEQAASTILTLQNALVDTSTSLSSFVTLNKQARDAVRLFTTSVGNVKASLLDVGYTVAATEQALQSFRATLQESFAPGQALDDVIAKLNTLEQALRQVRQQAKITVSITPVETELSAAVGKVLDQVVAKAVTSFVKDVKRQLRNVSRAESDDDDDLGAAGAVTTSKPKKPSPGSPSPDTPHDVSSSSQSKKPALTLKLNQLGTVDQKELRRLYNAIEQTDISISATEKFVLSDATRALFSALYQRKLEDFIDAADDSIKQDMIAAFALAVERLRISSPLKETIGVFPEKREYSIIKDFVKHFHLQLLAKGINSAALPETVFADVPASQRINYVQDYIDTWVKENVLPVLRLDTQGESLQNALYDYLEQRAGVVKTALSGRKKDTPTPRTRTKARVTEPHDVPTSSTAPSDKPNVPVRPDTLAITKPSFVDPFLSRVNAISNRLSKKEQLEELSKIILDEKKLRSDAVDALYKQLSDIQTTPDVDLSTISTQLASFLQHNGIENLVGDSRALFVPEVADALLFALNAVRNAQVPEVEQLNEPVRSLALGLYRKLLHTLTQQISSKGVLPSSDAYVDTWIKTYQETVLDKPINLDDYAKIVTTKLQKLKNKPTDVSFLLSSIQEEANRTADALEPQPFSFFGAIREYIAQFLRSKPVTMVTDYVKGLFDRIGEATSLLAQQLTDIIRGVRDWQPIIDRINKEFTTVVDVLQSFVSWIQHTLKHVVQTITYPLDAIPALQKQGHSLLKVYEALRNQTEKRPELEPFLRSGLELFEKTKDAKTLFQHVQQVVPEVKTVQRAVVSDQTVGYRSVVDFITKSEDMLASYHAAVLKALQESKTGVAVAVSRPTDQKNLTGHALVFVADPYSPVGYTTLQGMPSNELRLQDGNFFLQFPDAQDIGITIRNALENRILDIVPLPTDDMEKTAEFLKELNALFTDPARGYSFIERFGDTCSSSITRAANKVGLIPTEVLPASAGGINTALPASILEALRALHVYNPEEYDQLKQQGQSIAVTFEQEQPVSIETLQQAVADRAQHLAQTGIFGTLYGNRIASVFENTWRSMSAKRADVDAETVAATVVDAILGQTGRLSLDLLNDIADAIQRRKGLHATVLEQAVRSYGSYLTSTLQSIVDQASRVANASTLRLEVDSDAVRPAMENLRTALQAAYDKQVHGVTKTYIARLLRTLDVVLQTDVVQTAGLFDVQNAIAGVLADISNYLTEEVTTQYQSLTTKGVLDVSAFRSTIQQVQPIIDSVTTFFSKVYPSTFAQTTSVNREDVADTKDNASDGDVSFFLSLPKPVRYLIRAAKVIDRFIAGIQKGIYALLYNIAQSIIASLDAKLALQQGRIASVVDSVFAFPGLNRLRPLYRKYATLFGWDIRSPKVAQREIDREQMRLLTFEEGAVNYPHVSSREEAARWVMANYMKRFAGTLANPLRAQAARQLPSVLASRGFITPEELLQLYAIDDPVNRAKTRISAIQIQYAFYKTLEKSGLLGKEEQDWLNFIMQQAEDIVNQTSSSQDVRSRGSPPPSSPPPSSPPPSGPAPSSPRPGSPRPSSPRPGGFAPSSSPSGGSRPEDTTKPTTAQSLSGKQADRRADQRILPSLDEVSPLVRMYLTDPTSATVFDVPILTALEKFYQTDALEQELASYITYLHDYNAKRASFDQDMFTRIMDAVRALDLTQPEANANIQSFLLASELYRVMLDQREAADKIDADVKQQVIHFVTQKPYLDDVFPTQTVTTMLDANEDRIPADLRQVYDQMDVQKLVGYIDTLIGSDLLKDFASTNLNAVLVPLLNLALDKLVRIAISKTEDKTYIAAAATLLRTVLDKVITSIEDQPDPSVDPRHLYDLRKILEALYPTEGQPVRPSLFDPIARRQKRAVHSSNEEQLSLAAAKLLKHISRFFEEETPSDQPRISSASEQLIRRVDPTTPLDTTDQPTKPARSTKRRSTRRKKTTDSENTQRSSDTSEPSFLQMVRTDDVTAFVQAMRGVQDDVQRILSHAMQSTEAEELVRRLSVVTGTKTTLLQALEKTIGSESDLTKRIKEAFATASPQGMQFTLGSNPVIVSVLDAAKSIFSDADVVVHEVLHALTKQQLDPSLTGAIDQVLDTIRNSKSWSQQAARLVRQAHPTYAAFADVLESMPDYIYNSSEAVAYIGQALLTQNKDFEQVLRAVYGNEAFQTVKTTLETSFPQLFDPFTLGQRAKELQQINDVLQQQREKYTKMVVEGVFNPTRGAIDQIIATVTSFGSSLVQYMPELHALRAYVKENVNDILRPLFKTFGLPFVGIEQLARKETLDAITSNPEVDVLTSFFDYVNRVGSSRSSIKQIADLQDQFNQYLQRALFMPNVQLFGSILRGSFITEEDRAQAYFDDFNRYFQRKTGELLDRRFFSVDANYDLERGVTKLNVSARTASGALVQLNGELDRLGNLSFGEGSFIDRIRETFGQQFRNELFNELAEELIYGIYSFIQNIFTEVRDLQDEVRQLYTLTAIVGSTKANFDVFYETNRLVTEAITIAAQVGQGFQDAIQTLITNFKLLADVTDFEKRRQFTIETTKLQLSGQRVFDIPSGQGEEIIGSLFSQLRDAALNAQFDQDVKLDMTAAAEEAITNMKYIYDLVVLAQRETGATAQDVLQVYNGLYNTARTIGMTTQGMIAFISSASVRLAKSPSELLTSLNMFIERIYSSEASRKLRGLGISTFGVSETGELSFLPIQDIVAQINEKAQYDPAFLKTVSNIIGGRARASEVLAILSSFTSATQVEQRMVQAFTGFEFEEAFNAKSESLQGAIAKASANIGLFFQNVLFTTGIIDTVSKALIGLTDPLRVFASLLTTSEQAANALNPVLRALVDILVVQFFGFSKNVIGFITSKIGSQLPETGLKELRNKLYSFNPGDTALDLVERVLADFDEINKKHELFVGDLRKTIERIDTVGTELFSSINRFASKLHQTIQDTAQDIAGATPFIASKPGVRQGDTNVPHGQLTQGQHDDDTKKPTVARDDDVVAFVLQQQQLSAAAVSNAHALNQASAAAKEFATTAHSSSTSFIEVVRSFIAGMRNAGRFESTTFWASPLGRMWASRMAIGSEIGVSAAFDLFYLLGAENKMESAANIGVGIAGGIFGALVSGANPLGAVIGYQMAQAFSESIDAYGFFATSERERDVSARRFITMQPEQRDLLIQFYTSGKAKELLDLVSQYPLPAPNEFEFLRRFTTPEMTFADYLNPLILAFGKEQYLQMQQAQYQQLRERGNATPTSLLGQFMAAMGGQRGFVLLDELRSVHADLPDIIASLGFSRYEEVYTFLEELAEGYGEARNRVRNQALQTLTPYKSDIESEIEASKRRIAPVQQTTPIPQFAPFGVSYRDLLTATEAKLTTTPQENLVDVFDAFDRALQRQQTFLRNAPALQSVASALQLTDLVEQVGQLGREGQQAFFDMIDPIARAIEYVNEYKTLLDEISRMEELLATIPEYQAPEEYQAVLDTITSYKEKAASMQETYAVYQQYLDLVKQEPDLLSRTIALLRRRQEVQQKKVIGGTPAQFRMPSLFDVSEYTVDQLQAALVYAREKQADIIRMFPQMRSEFAKDQFIFTSGRQYVPVTGVSQQFVQEYLQQQRARTAIPDVVDLRNLDDQTLQKVLADAFALQANAVALAPHAAAEYANEQYLILRKNNELLLQTGLSQEFLRYAIEANTKATDTNTSELRGHYNLPASYRPPTIWDYYASGGTSAGMVNYVPPPSAAASDMVPLELARTLAHYAQYGQTATTDLSALGSLIDPNARPLGYPEPGTPGKVIMPDDLELPLGITTNEILLQNVPLADILRSRDTSTQTTARDQKNWTLLSDRLRDISASSTSQPTQSSVQAAAQTTTQATVPYDTVPFSADMADPSLVSQQFADAIQQAVDRVNTTSTQPWLLSTLTGITNKLKTDFTSLTAALQPMSFSKDNALAVAQNSVAAAMQSFARSITSFNLQQALQHSLQQAFTSGAITIIVQAGTTGQRTMPPPVTGRGTTTLIVSPGTAQAPTGKTMAR